MASANERLSWLITFVVDHMLEQDAVNVVIKMHHNDILGVLFTYFTLSFTIL